ncbi:peroxisomal membrane 22 kDa (Mpv17/PMP22) family protein [Wolffia australiana]
MLSLGKGDFPWKLPEWRRSRPPRRRRRCKGSDGAEGSGGKRGSPFPFKQAATASALVLAGDTIAQVSSRLKAARAGSDESSSLSSKEIASAVLFNHDWTRAIRMASYGFLLYGPGSYAWYQFLDRAFPGQTIANLSAKVILNQVVLGPCVIAVIFAWNNLWLGQISQLPKKYRNDALPTLLYGFRFWVPVSVLNFWVIPLQARVAFMSTCSVFWNFYLSSALSK